MAENRRGDKPNIFPLGHPSRNVGRVQNVPTPAPRPAPVPAPAPAPAVVPDPVPAAAPTELVESADSTPVENTGEQS